MTPEFTLGEQDWMSSKDKERFGELKNKLERGLKKEHVKLFPYEWDMIWYYLGVQMVIKKGDTGHAREMYSDLLEKTGYGKFEDDNPRVLATIDFAVHNRTNREDYKKKPIVPLFKIN